MGVEEGSSTRVSEIYMYYSTAIVFSCQGAHLADKLCKLPAASHKFVPTYPSRLP